MGEIAKVECVECNGTGAKEPDCWVCKGQRSIHIKRAYLLGYKKGDLEGLDGSDDYCDCPRYECHGDSCDFCEGDGKVTAIEAKQQAWRVLYFAARDEIPPLFSLDHRGRIFAQDKLLSLTAARRCRDRGLISWFCSFFGDEISLTEKGERVARRLHLMPATTDVGSVYPTERTK